jgi:acetyl-CoA synthetase
LDADDREGDEGEVCVELDPKPTGLMLGYQQEDARFAPLGATVYRTVDVAMRDADGYLTFVGGPTTSSRSRTTASARSSWRAL